METILKIYYFHKYSKFSILAKKKNVFIRKNEHRVSLDGMSFTKPMKTVSTIIN